jgi:hypothetical protein
MRVNRELVCGRPLILAGMSDDQGDVPKPVRPAESEDAKGLVTLAFGVIAGAGHGLQ